MISCHLPNQILLINSLYEVCAVYQELGVSTLSEALSFKKQNKAARDKTTSEIGEMVCFKKKMIERL